MKPKVSLLEIENNPQIGLYFVATNDFVLCGKANLKEEEKKSIEEILQVPLLPFSCYSSEIIGVFMQVDMYSKTFFIPKDLPEKEKNILQEISSKYQYSIIELSSLTNAIGNLLAPTPNAVIISSELKKYTDELKRKTQKKIIILDNLEFHQAGALIKSLNSKTLASSELNNQTIEEIENEVDNISTANSGSAYISSAIVGNDKGILIGNITTTVEIQTILETFEFL